MKTMKTRIANQEVSLNGVILILAITMVLSSTVAYSQEDDSTETLFRSNVHVSELWTPEVKINSIQGDIGTLIGFYGGALFNHTFLLGISGGVNLSHPRINYGYFGVIGQYIYRPEKLVHCSVQWLLAHGSAKDYENPKSSLFDNFWNISGAGFYLMEPGFNLEINLGRRVILATGVSYRYVTGLSKDNENISITHVTNNDLSGVNFNIGLKFGKERKTR
jgi:hypothetical protein